MKETQKRSAYRLVKRNNNGNNKWSSRNEGFEDKKRRGRLIFLNKAAKIVLKKVT